MIVRSHHAITYFPSPALSPLSPCRMPYHIGRETWHAYDTKNAWFWKAPAKK